MGVPTADTKDQQSGKRDLLLIHGAWSSSTTFNYLKSRIKQCDALGDIIDIDYDTNRSSITSIVRHCDSVLHECVNPVVVVGHSMGGIIALNLHDHPNVESLVTVASPLSGLNINKFLQVLIAIRSPNITDIMHMSPFITQTHCCDYHKPITCLITTKGYNPAWYEQSDGVVTVSSQKSWVPCSAEVYEIPYNHHEVLQSPEFYQVVEEKILKC